MDKILNKSLQFISLLSTASLVLAVVHEVGYFTSLDLSLLKLVSLSDYLQSAIVWLPTTIAPVGIGIYWARGDILYRQHILNNLPEGEEKKIRMFFNKHGMDILFYVMIGTSMLGAVVLPLELATTYYVMSVGGVGLVVVRTWLNNSHTLNFVDESIRDIIRPVIMMTVIFIGVVFSNGYTQGISDRFRKTSNFSISESGAEDAILLRALERGYLVRNIKDNRLLLKGANQEVILSLQLPFPDKRSVACRWTGYLCNSYKRSDQAP